MTHCDLAGERVPQTTDGFSHDRTQGWCFPQSSHRKRNSDNSLVVLRRLFFAVFPPDNSGLSGGFVERNLFNSSTIGQAIIDDWVERFGQSVQSFIYGDPLVRTEVYAIVDRAPKGTCSSHCGGLVKPETLSSEEGAFGKVHQAVLCSVSEYWGFSLTDGLFVSFEKVVSSFPGFAVVSNEVRHGSPSLSYLGRDRG